MQKDDPFNVSLKLITKENVNAGLKICKAI